MTLSPLVKGQPSFNTSEESKIDKFKNKGAGDSSYLYSIHTILPVVHLKGTVSRKSEIDEKELKCALMRSPCPVNSLEL